ncbi:YggL family protein [Psychromonas sp. Urea-02u-13]|uniref:YggL 50S ribosome-binding family protein n=1 Tax=Psychromonas sp. Urea-02u-13 TaxID=2058326 RepID=UPI000C340471|nr:YggL family protein [Psychromonas sp. Urea-02u-13]PKG40927.1 hypothetical protein CXF74_01000 [Psychromonas sp. Urea-02u-13]
MSSNQTIKRSRRLRKKLYIDEFSVYGFEITITFADFDENSFDAFLDEMVDFIESRNLVVEGGGGVDEFEAFISSNERYGSASEDDRNVISTWLESKPVIQSVEVSDLVDANYDF